MADDPHVDYWDVVYKKAIADDGTLLFPERLTTEFLARARRTMGSYLFANQYQNEVISEDEKVFKRNWLRYFNSIPQRTNRFAFIDPAIGQNKHNDYTGICVIHTDSSGLWYLVKADRYRLTPTQIIDKMFELVDVYQLNALGVEIVAYQEALLYILDEAMQKRRRILPVKGVRRQGINKNTRILGLVPRFEWGKLLVNQGMTDFEDEYNSFPRASHDDILDALASLEEIVSYPENKEVPLERPESPHDPNYERWLLHDLQKRANESD